MINNLKITDVIYNKLVVVTTGEDEYVKFWDKNSFDLISKFSVRKYFPENSDHVLRKNVSIQNIDIFACKPPPLMTIDGKQSTGYEKDNPVLLMSTRDGNVIEVTLSTVFIELKATPGELGQDLENSGDLYEGKNNYQTIKNIEFHQRIIMSHHSSQISTTIGQAIPEFLNQRGLKFSVHPFKPTMVTAGLDNELVYWCTNTHKSKKNFHLKNTPT